MNFCTKCGSYYHQPGTCNCFAPAKVDASNTNEPETLCPICGQAVWMCRGVHWIYKPSTTTVQPNITCTPHYGGSFVFPAKASFRISNQPPPCGSG